MFDAMLAEVKPLLMYIIGISLYAVFVFKFYKFLAKRDILRMHVFLNRRGVLGYLQYESSLFLYILENLVIVPILVFFWFLILAVLLMIIGKSHSPATLLLTSIAIVGAIRLTAYYNEALSQDLAKMVPFALLGVLLQQPDFFSFQHIWTIIDTLPYMTLLYYLGLVVCLEFVLRIIKGVLGLFQRNESSVD
ncbi:MAG: hypothetical protein ACQESG_05225 [Nanobdellota archaeon]